VNRALLLGLWLAALAALAVLALGRLEVSGDLRMFMPTAQGDDERLLLDTLGEGPGSRMLLLALSGGDADALADHSRALADALREQPLLRRVANGDDAETAIDDALLPYRYLLSPTLDTARFDEEFLRQSLQDRLQDLGSPAAMLVEPWIARDPTLEMLQLAELWRPATEPERHDGVWLSADGTRALLLVETAEGGFDPEAQRAGIAAIRGAVAALDDARLRLEISGPGAFSVLLHERTRSEATRLGVMASVAMLLLLGLAYRRWSLPLLGALPLASAALAGLAATSLLFGSVHGITLAFGFTLLGLAQDYPVHLFSNLRPRAAATRVVRELWPTLATGALSTCLAYASFAFAGVVGLLQLAVFTVVGLAVAAACTRWLLPSLLTPPARDLADNALLQRIAARLLRLPRAAPVLLLLAAAGIAYFALSPRSPWDDNLASLTPVPADLLQRDGELRRELGAPDVRYLLVIEADHRDALLQASEALDAALQGLVDAGALDSFDPPHRYLPSAERQRARQAQLPDDAALQAMLDEAVRGLPFREGLFAPFRADIAAARTAPLLDAAALADTPLAARLESLLPRSSARPTALISLGGVREPQAIAALAATLPGAHLLDLKSASEALASRYRERVLWALGAAILLLVITLSLALRGAERVQRVLLPMLLASVFSVVALHAAGVGFTLFHLVSLILAAGLGLDYALFFERAGQDAAEQRRTLHAVLVCAASTTIVFGLLATSGIPVLRAIGLTVTVGVLLQFSLAVLVACRRPADAVA
jgi:predicted exporter